jgi:hypothetical protein
MDRKKSVNDKCVRSMADSVAEDDENDTEARVWNMFEHVFCFLKGMTIYQTRRRLKFVIVSQAVINTMRIFPIILGLSYQATLPVLILVRCPPCRSWLLVSPMTASR